MSSIKLTPVSHTMPWEPAAAAAVAARTRSGSAELGLPLHRDAGGAGGRVALHPFLAALVHVHRLLVVALTQDARRSMDESETRKAREEEVAPPLARELHRQAI